MEVHQATMTIPSRACALLISVIQAITTAAAIQTAAAAILLAQVMATIRPDQALVLALTAVRDLTAAAVMIIITVANRQS